MPGRPDPARSDEGQDAKEDSEQSADAANDTGTYQTASQVAPASSNEAGNLWARGLDLYRSGRFEEAAERFHGAVQAAPGDAKYAYFHAAALHRAGHGSEAADALTLAVQAEERAPIANWGRTLERIQGATRVWLEQNRSAAATHVAARVR